MSNNPPEVLVALSLADAQMLLEDSEASIHQILGVMDADDTARRAFLLKLVNLLEFKKRLKEACEKGISE